MIDLPFDANALKTVLAWGLDLGSPTATHQEIAHWCDRFHMMHIDSNCSPEMDLAVRVAADVDCQWDLYLANTYSIAELQALDFSKVRLPQDWFQDWLRELEA